MSLTSYLGIDVGSVTTKLALVDEKGQYVDSYMLKTAGKPVMAVQSGLRQILEQANNAGREYNIMGVGTTGSGRNLAGALVGADVVKNEIISFMKSIDSLTAAMKSSFILEHLTAPMDPEAADIVDVYTRIEFIEHQMKIIKAKHALYYFNCK